MSNKSKLFSSDVSSVVSSVLSSSLEQLSSSDEKSEGVKLVMFVGYTESENSSLLKTLSQEVLKEKKSVHAVGKKDSDMYITEKGISIIFNSLSDGHDVDYTVSTDEIAHITDLSPHVEYNITDYLIIENPSVAKEDTLDHFLKSCRIMTDHNDCHVVVTMSTDEFAQIKDKILDRDVVFIA